MSEREERAPANPAACERFAADGHDVDDPVGAVILAYLDHLEGAAPRPALDQLGEADQARAQLILDGLAHARGLDPYATRPTIEELLTDTPLAGLLSKGPVDLTTVRQALSGVDRRAWVELDRDTVLYSYLDVRARFLLVPGETPTITRAVRDWVATLFRDDADTTRVGVIAADSEELVTILLAPDDLGDTITTPRGERPVRLPSPLPLALAVRKMLEQTAPEWPAFDVGPGGLAALDVPELAAGIAERVIAREAARSYRGEKRRAYQALAGQAAAFADLVAQVRAGGGAVDLDAEISRLAA